MEYHLKFKNGRSCEIECESTGTPLQDKINRAEERFGSPVATINGKAVKEHGLGGFILGTILGGAVASNMTKTPKKKSPKPKVKTFKSSSTSKSGRAKDRKYVNADEDYETRYSKDKPARKGYSNRDVMNLETMAKGGKTKEVIEAEKELKKAKASKISSYIDEASKKLDTAYEKEKYAEGGSIKVGIFDETQLRNQEDKKAVEKAQKETGLKYVDTKIIKKGGKMYLEVYLIPNEEYYKSSKFKKGGAIKVGDKVTLPEIKMSNGNIQFEKVEDGEVIYINEGIYGVKNPKTNRIHKVRLDQIKMSKGGSTDRDEHLKHELNEFLQDPDGDGFGIFGYTNRIHEIMMGRDDEYKPSELDEYLIENGIYGYTSRIKRIYDEKYADGGYVGTGGTMDSSMGDAPTIGGTMASSMYAKGGLSEHGLKKGDYILNDLSEYDKKAGKNLITVIDKKDHSPHMVNLNEGIRYAKGGEVEKGFKVFNYTDNLYASDEVFKTKQQANEFIKEFRNRFAKQGYYRDNRMRKIAIKDIDLLAIPSDFNPFRQYAKGGKAEPDTYFSKLYNPNTNFLRDGKVIDVEYKSSFNYDISINFKYNSKGEIISAKVIHEIKEWEYDLSEATEIGGFENNADDFHKLAEITDNVIKSNLDVYKQILKTGKTEYGYYDTKPLDTKLISALETLYKSWGAKQTYAKGGSIVSDEQQAKDNNFLKDVIYTLSEEGLTIDGKELSREEAMDYVLKHASKLIALGRDGWNPFDAVYIVEGHPEETDIPEKAMKYAEGGGVYEDPKDLKNQAIQYLQENYPDYTDAKVGELSDEDYNDIFFEMVDDVREKFGLGEDYDNVANGIVEHYMSSGKYATGGMIGKEIMYNYYGEKKIGTITEILPSGDYVVHAGFGQRSVSPSDVISEMETKKKRFGFFKSGGLSDTPKKGYDIVGKTMHEFKQGKLRSSSGDIVTDREQALAIALSKERRGYFKEGGILDEYHESKYLTKEQWERWNEWVKTGKIDGKKEDNVFAVAGWVGKSISNINAYQIEQRSKKLKMRTGGSIEDLSEYLNYLEGEDLETMKAYIESKNPKRVIGKDRYGNDVRIGDAIHIRILTGRYGQTKDYEGIVTDYDKFGNVELDGQRKVTYTANYVHNDYEHGHHIWAEKIDPKDIRDSLRVPKKFVPTFSSREDVYGEEIIFKGTEKEFRDYLDFKFPGNVFGQWFPLYNLGWRIVGDNYFSPDHKKYDGFSFYESVEQGQGYLNTLLIPKSEKRSKNEKMAKGGVTYPDLSKEKPDDIIQDQGTLFEVEPKEKEKITKIPEVDLTIEKNEFFKNLPKVNSSESAVNILRKFWDKAQINVQEYFYVLLLSQNNKPISVYHQSKGGVASTIADVELTCAVAVKSLARAVIIAHNHPSGELRFSDADKQLTVKLAKALKTLDIALLDSMIVTDESYLSMADEGQLPTV